MTLLNQDVPEAVARQNPIIQSLDRALTRGDKLFTGQPKENLDMMFTKLLIVKLETPILEFNEPIRTITIALSLCGMK